MSSRQSSSSQSLSWKSCDADETMKTRRNALRVIVQKLRNYWAADSEARLTERATLLEKGVYDVTNNKTDYIQRLQRDLSLLSNKKELEKKAMRMQIQQAGDIYAQHAQEDGRTGTVPPNMTADAKAKFTQKIYTMDKKHSNKFILLKLTEERLKGSPSELKMKEQLQLFKVLHGQRDKGPFDVKKLNDIDEKLDQLQVVAATRPTVRVAPNRETVDKQNDRTQLIGQRMVDKLRKLNRERPFVVAEVTSPPSLCTPTLCATHEQYANLPGSFSAPSHPCVTCWLICTVTAVLDDRARRPLV